MLTDDGLQYWKKFLRIRLTFDPVHVKVRARVRVISVCYLRRVAVYLGYVGYIWSSF